MTNTIYLEVSTENTESLISEVARAASSEAGAANISESAIQEALKKSLTKGAESLGSGGLLLRVAVADLTAEVQLLVRVPKEVTLDSDGEPSRLIWVALHAPKETPDVSTCAEFAAMMKDPEFHQQVSDAQGLDEIDALYRARLDAEVHFEHHVMEELRPTGKWFLGLKQDIQRRLPHYKSDFTDGPMSKVFASTVFMFFACLAPAIAFGGMLSLLTGGVLGVTEMLVGTVLCGIVYALFSGQPLCIPAGTGPILIFMGILYRMCHQYELPFLPTLAWIGLWTGLILIIMAITEASCLIRYFTRFTDEIFAALISLIFIYDAVHELMKAFHAQSVDYGSAFFTLILGVGTFVIALRLAALRKTPYLRPGIRNFLADFGTAIAIFAMSGLALYFGEVSLERLAVPDSLQPSIDRSWFVNPLDAPTWIWFASIVPAFLVSILVFIDQNITGSLLNSMEFNFKKGFGFHLDLVVVGVLLMVCSLFGLPWMVTATVRSINHVRSLQMTDENGKSYTLESRLTGLLIHLLIGCSLFALNLVKMIPMPVLFGLFLYMGFTSMSGNQFFSRLALWATDPKEYPSTAYVRAVPNKVIHKFTFIQVLCLAGLWIVKKSPLGLLFPLAIALLVPVRFALDKLFEPEHLALLDSHETPEEEEFRETR